MGKPAVILDLDRPRRIRFSMNNMCLAEDKLGIPMSRLDFNNIGFKELRTLVFCTLEDKHDLKDEAFVGDLIDEYAPSIEYVGDKIKEAVELAFGSKKQMPVETQAEQEENQESGTGMK